MERSLRNKLEIIKDTASVGMQEDCLYCHEIWKIVNTIIKDEEEK